MKNSRYSELRQSLSLIRFYAAYILLFLSFNLQAQSYCASKGIMPWQQWIGGISITPTFNNTTSKEGYGNFTALTGATLQRGSAALFTLSPQSSWGADPLNTQLYWRVWIDYNGDGDFLDADEQIISRQVTIANGVFLDNEQAFAVPATAQLGNKRLRVSMKQGGYPTPCETFDRGEVEDYTVNIQGGISNLPDLTLTNLTVTTPSVQQGQTLSYKFDMKNLGGLAETHSIRIVASANTVYDASDVEVLLITNQGGLAAGYSALGLVFNTALSATFPPGQYYLIAKIDANDVIVESNENNNVVVAATTFTVTAGQTGGYCPSKGIAPWEIWNAQFSIVNPFFFNISGKEGYGNFTALTGAALTRGETNLITISPEASWPGDPRNANLFWRVWIDYNDDGDFTDAGEQAINQNVVFTNGSFLDNQSTFAVPTSATLGRTRLRMALKYGSPPTPCETFDRGEVEDYTITIQGGSAGSADIALSLTATPSVFKPFTPLNFTISAQNNDNQPFTNVKIEFKFPVGTTNGGSATPSVGTWNEWCASGIQCFTWTIPTLSANSTATLNVPVYVLNPTAPLVATAKLLSSTPIDNVVSNNTATLSLNQALPPIAASAKVKPTQLIPIVVEKIAPNPSDGQVILALESLDERVVSFNFSDAFGKTVKSESRKVEKGNNRVLFEVWELPQGIYFVSPSTHKGHGVPTKFMKM